MTARPNTPEGDRLDVIVTLVETYERKHFPMEQIALTPKDLVPMIGGLNRVYEILNRKRPLALRMVWRLHKELGIPAESLIRPPEEGLVA